MIHINLLPWREEKRKKRQQRFLYLLLFVVGGMAALLIGWHFYVNAQISYQESRNQFLKQQIAEVDKKLKEIEALDKTKASILARMQVIQDLQAGRPAAVHLMDELVTNIPDGVYLTEITQSGTRVTLKGMAQSNARVSALMRNIELSEWITSPQLQVVENKSQDKAAGLSQFTLSVTQKLKSGPEEAQQQGQSQ